MASSGVSGQCGSVRLVLRVLCFLGGVFTVGADFGWIPRVELSRVARFPPARMFIMVGKIAGLWVLTEHRCGPGNFLLRGRAVSPGSRDASGFFTRNTDVLHLSGGVNFGVTEVLSAATSQGHRGTCRMFSATRAVVAVGAGCGWIPCGSLSSCTPSIGTYGFGWDGGWTVGALVFLSTVAGLANSLYFPCAAEQFTQGSEAASGFRAFYRDTARSSMFWLRQVGCH